MTRDEILNLGIYEIEQLVIDKILGWELSDRGFYADKDGQSPESYYTPANFKPGRDIEAAWLLVERLRLVVRPSVLRDKWVAGRFLRVYFDNKIEYDCEVTADTAPLAICKTGLLAVMDPA